MWKEIQQTKKLHGHSELRALMHMADVLLPHAITQPLRRFAGRSHAAPVWLTRGILGGYGDEPLNETSSRHNSIQMMSAAQLTATNLPMLLHWEDRASMAHSIEARVPFLDYRLVEFVLGLPEEFKLSGGVTKRVQRTGMNGVIPDGIRDRMDKVGFATPEELWVKAQGTDFFRAQLRQAVDRSQGILGEESFSMLEDMISGQRPFSYLPWRLINFGEWMHTFSVSKI
jgi:asparagine synthase (glutamine-hydrolysing)